MPAELTVRAPDIASEREYTEIAAYLRRLPDAHEEGHDFTFREEEAGVFFVVTPSHATNVAGPDAAGRCDQARVRVPNDLIPTTREPVAEFVFSLARQYGWQVYEGNERYADEAGLVRRLGGVLQPPGGNGCATMLSLLLVFGVLLLLR